MFPKRIGAILAVALAYAFPCDAGEGRLYKQIEDLHERARYGEAAGVCIAAVRESVHCETLPACEAIRLRCAWVYVDLGRVEEAELLARSVLSARNVRLGQQHSDTAKALYMLGYIQLKAGKVLDAIDSLRVAAQQLSALGSFHRVGLYATATYAGALRQAGENRRAEQLLKSVIAALGSNGGMSGQDGAVLAELATALVMQGKYAEARPILQQALNVTRAYYTASHPQFASVLSALGQLDLLIGRPDQAVSHLEAAVRISGVFFPPDHSIWVQLYGALGTAYRMSNRDVEAEEALRHALSIATKAFVIPRGDLAAIAYQLAAHLVRQGKRSEAREILARYPLDKASADGGSLISSQEVIPSQK